ncbi:MAG: SLC13 family permease [Planctomycetaceae bacterium]
MTTSEHQEFAPENSAESSQSTPAAWLRWFPIALSVICLLILLSPTPEGMTPEAHRLLAVTLLMAGLWMTQALPLAATSLIPLAAFPLLGIMPAKAVAKAFANDSLFLYLGGMILALGIERWNLHRRIALNLVSVVGVSPRRLVGGFMITSAVLSMWISNTACTMLMVPIALAMLKTLDEGSESTQIGSTTASKKPSETLAVPLLLSIAYSCSLGGMSTIIGTPTNSVAVGILQEQMPQVPRITVAVWILAAAPVSIVMLLITWWTLTRRLGIKTNADARLRMELESRLRTLGPATRAEIRVFAVFALTAAAWVFQKPLRVNGVTVVPGIVDIWSWAVERASNLVGNAPPQLTGVSDTTIAIIAAIVLFIIPAGVPKKEGAVVRLMDWPSANRLPWEMILLFGGGFALAEGFTATELSAWLRDSLQGPLAGRPAWVVIAALCFMLTFLTEFTSNVATVNTLLPTLIPLAEPLGIDVRLLFLPVTLSASCAFMMPIATPPNAIVFGSGRVSIRQMAMYGLLLNVIGVAVMTIGTFAFIEPILRLIQTD